MPPGQAEFGEIRELRMGPRKPSSDAQPNTRRPLGDEASAPAVGRGHDRTDHEGEHDRADDRDSQRRPDDRQHDVEGDEYDDEHGELGQRPASAERPNALTAPPRRGRA